MTHYARLGVEESASEHHIRRAFHRVARTCHPDLFPGDESKEAEFKSLSDAFETLSNPSRRLEYDARLRSEREKAVADWFARMKRAAAAPEPQSTFLDRMRAAPSELSWGRLIVAGLGLGLAAWMESRGSTYWDADVGRYRGPDGRFR